MIREDSKGVLILIDEYGTRLELLTLPEPGRKGPAFWLSIRGTLSEESSIELTPDDAARLRDALSRRLDESALNGE
jgi:hypothetical protein